MKKIVAFTVILCLCISSLTGISAVAQSNEKNYLPPVDLGEFIETCQPLDSVVEEIDGVDYLFSSSTGSPAVFNIYNLDAQQYIKSYELTDSSSPWIHVKDSKGKIYIAADAYVYSYDPYSDQFESLGKCLSTESATFVMTIDENDNLYIGTYPSAKIVKYDSVQKEFIDLGTVEKGANYVRSIAYHNGYLYCGTFGNGAPKFIRMNPNNPEEKKEFPVPANDSYYDVNEMIWIYTMNTLGDYIVIYASAEGITPMLVFDTNTERFIDIDFEEYYRGLYTTPELNGKAYCITLDKMYEIDITNGFQITDFDFPIPYKTSFRGGGWITVEDDPDFPGKSYCTVDTGDGSPTIYNMQTKKYKKLTDHGQKGGKINLQAIEKGPGDEIYLGGYMGHQGAAYNVKTGSTVTFPIGQTEGMVEYNGKMYFGIYPKAWLYEYDPSLPVDSKTNPKALAQIEESQDRPFALTAADGKIFIGTVPDYGQLGGALSIYDLASGKMTTVRNLVQNQSIISLAVKDGMLYGSTSAYGGLASTPSEKQAKLFVYDYKNNEKVKEVTVDIPGVSNPLCIGGISFDESGLLWCVSGKTLFAVDLDTQKVVKSKVFEEFSYNPSSHQWRPTYIRWASDGLLYTNINGIKAVDTETMNAIDLQSLTGNAALFTIGTDGNLYYNSGSHLKMIPVSSVAMDNSNLTEIRTYFTENIGLFVDNPLAMAKGEPQSIDPANSDVKPIVQNDRTLVPVRFIAETLGADAAWDDSTQTATLTKGDSVVNVTLNQKEMLVNGERVPLDVPAQTVNDRTLLPLRAVSDAFSKQVYWEPSGSGLIIISDEPVTIDRDMTQRMIAYFRFYIKSDKKETRFSAK